MLYRTVQDIDFQLSGLRAMDAPRSLLMTSPDYFDVQYVINPHMSGNVGTVDTEEARRQWNALKSTYTDIGLDVHVVPGRKGLPDMVFCANQTLPFVDSATGERGVFLSNMHAPERMQEVEHFERFFDSLGYTTQPIDDGTRSNFEGMGDAIWHTGRHLLWGGHGFRTHDDVYEYIARVLDIPVILLLLEDPDFYHLDTCLSVLNETTALIYPGAFQDEGVELIQRVFPHVIEAPESESRSLFACNAHCPDGRHVIIQRGCSQTVALLKSAGFESIEVDTGEFLKAGGSVFCMKQMFW